MTPTMPGASASHARAPESRIDADGTTSPRRTNEKHTPAGSRFAEELERSLPGPRGRHEGGTASARRRKGRAGSSEIEATPSGEATATRHPHPVLQHADAKRHAADPVPPPSARVDALERARGGTTPTCDRAEPVGSAHRRRPADEHTLDAAPPLAKDPAPALTVRERALVADAAAAPGIDAPRASGATESMTRVAAADDVGILLAVHSARVVVDVGAEGPLTVVVRVRDGAADVRALGPAAQALASGEVSLRRSLGEHGLDLGSFSAHDERGSWSGHDGRRELEEHRELFTDRRAPAAPATPTGRRRGLRA